MSLGWLSRALAVLSLAVVVSGCGPAESDGEDGGGSTDGGPPACKPAEDSDQDGIPNSIETCTRDTDQDGRPDYFDTDADGDTIPDAQEVGANPAQPRDTDGDGAPDYIDKDSDNDGASDGNEDRNHDGVLGSCTTTCSAGGGCMAGEYCSLRPGAAMGVCTNLTCLEGESDPYNNDTDGDGTLDGSEGTAICNPRGEMGSSGLKEVQFRTSTVGNWKVALELASSYQDLLLSGTPPTAAAAVFDLGADEVAGFIVALPASSAGPLTEVTALNGRIIGAAGVGPGGVLSSGSIGKSLDNYDTARGVTLEINVTGTSDVSTIRNATVARVLNVAVPSLGSVPGPFGATTNRFVISYQVLFRNATDMIVMGAVTSRAGYDDPMRTTGWHAEDLSNGTGLATASNTDAVECEQFVVKSIPKADIFWIIDQSASTDEDRTLIVDNAVRFFNQATAQGLDFRMGVTDMDNASLGKLSRGPSAAMAYGAFISPAERTIFEAAIRDPSGSGSGDCCDEHGFGQAVDAVRRHLPRSSADATKIRDDAKVVVIIESDESTQELYSGGTYPDGTTFTAIANILNTSLTPAQMTELATRVAPFATFFKNNMATVHTISAPAPPAGGSICTSGGGTVGWGYPELAAATGGQSASICQMDLSLTISRILDDISGAASPVVLKKFPISLSIAVARDGMVLARSRMRGFDYRFAGNSIVFFGLPFDAARPSEVTVSYRRYQMQRPID